MLRRTYVYPPDSMLIYGDEVKYTHESLPNPHYSLHPFTTVTRTLERDCFPLPYVIPGPKTRCYSSVKVHPLHSPPPPSREQTKTPITITNIVNRVVFTSIKKNIQIVYDDTGGEADSLKVDIRTRC